MYKMEWKWSNGEKYERSPRIRKNGHQIREEREMISEQESGLALKNTEKMAITSCLLSEEENYNFNMEQQQNMMFQLNEPNKREDAYNRISEREMVCQVNMNPFFSQQFGNNYLDNIMVQDNFLKPMNTSMEKEREKELN